GRLSRVVPPSCSGGRFVEKADEVAGFAARRVGELVPAARAVCGEQRIGRCRTHFGQYAELADLQRYFIMLGLVAERAGHAAAGRVERLDSEAWDQLQGLCCGLDGAECLLVAVT